mmetsp:Transcript_29594/g.45185  ORF Transcript_29594/g.45185 Transcript_29594/m.45185 type:complete len:217 (-) Transcript_29594:212-862(-)
MVGIWLLTIILLIICVDPSTALSSSPQQGRGGDGRRPLPLPNRSHTPLDIVNFQLSALQDDDIYTVFKYASPANKAATGPWQRFGTMVHQEPYSILVGHDRAEVLLEWREPPPPRRYPYLPLKKKIGSSYKCLVRIWSSSANHTYSAKNKAVINCGNDDEDGSRLSSSSSDGGINGRDSADSAVVCKEFKFILSEQSDAGDPLFAGCWMVDGVIPL